MFEESELLREYVATRSDEAFRRLVDRYVNVVYASARRQVRDADLARDVTQAVFLVLAEKAIELDLHGGKPLSAWLLQVTRYASANAVRARARRARHEQRAAAMAMTNDRDGPDWEASLSPLLDQGMSRLRSKDRDVLLLRFFEQKTAREIGQAFGISEDAAEKRISRAVEKLRDFFRRRGVVVSLVALSRSMATHAAEAAPPGLNATIAAAAETAASATTGAATGATAGTIAKGTLITMATAKTKSLIVVAMALLLLGGGAIAVTSLIRSSKPRRVVVPVAATAPTSLPALAVTSPAPPPATATFSNGTTFEILGITDTPGLPARWWSADGTPIAAPSPLPSPASAPDPGEHAYQVIVRKTDPPTPASDNLSWSIYLDGPKISSMSLGDFERLTFKPGDTQMLNFVFHTRDQPAQGNVLMKLGHAPWTEDIRINVAAAATKPATARVTAPATQPTVTLENIADDRRGRAEVTVRFSPEHDRDSGYLDTQAFLIDAAGKPHLYGGTRSSRHGGVVFTGFAISAEQAVAFQYRYRPWERREVRNVSLRPGQKTNVAVGEVAPRPR